ncbi:MAG TPA: hypothetical protein VII48_13930, partial [Rhizomicrobium sp.]
MSIVLASTSRAQPVSFIVQKSITVSASSATSALQVMPVTEARTSAVNVAARAVPAGSAPWLASR